MKNRIKTFLWIAFLIILPFWAGTGFEGLPPAKVVEHRIGPVMDMSTDASCLYFSTVDENTKKVIKYSLNTVLDYKITYFGDIENEKDSYCTYKTSTYWPFSYEYTLHTTENKARFLLR